MSCATENSACNVEKQAAAEQVQSGRAYVPAVDIIELADELLLMADVPGVVGDDVNVQFEDGELRIHAPVKPRQASGGGYLLQEYGVGDYHRVFRLGQQIDATRITAECADGVLTVHLPKVEAVKPRKITVKTA